MNVNVGIDIGSTTVKIVVVRDGEIIHKHYERHFSKVREKAVELVRAARGLIGEDTPLRCSITGSAGLGVAKAADIDFVQEVFATRKAVGVHVPQADVVIELGGEDAKIVFLTGQLEERMNGSCAGGTGAFIDQMATLLNVTVDELDALSLQCKLHEMPNAPTDQIAVALHITVFAVCRTKDFCVSHRNGGLFADN